MEQDSVDGDELDQDETNVASETTSCCADRDAAQDDAAPERTGDPTDRAKSEAIAAASIASCLTAAEAIKVLSEFSAVVGMHPDQATEFLVDLALHFGRPFAVVPCCVYAKLFPGRCLKDGRPVKSYNELVEYLMEKNPAIRCKTLGFEGRNKVLYYLGRAHETKV